MNKEKEVELEQIQKPDPSEHKAFLKEMDDITDQRLEEDKRNEEDTIKTMVSSEDASAKKEDASGEEPPADTEEEKPDTQEEDEEEAGEKTPALPQELIERAVRAGMPLEAASGFQKPEHLSQVVSTLEATQAKESAEDGKSEEAGEEEDPFKDLALDPGEWDEELVGKFDAMRKILSEQHKELNELKRERQQTGETQKVNQFRQWFDGQVEGLGDDYADAFSPSDMKASEVAKMKVARRMDVLREDARLEGKEPPGPEELFKQAVESVFPNITKKSKGKSVEEKAAKRSKQVLEKPRDDTGKFLSENATPEDLEQEAIQAVAALME